jgi:membrane protease YdiL (CAAX protease family)
MNRKQGFLTQQTTVVLLFLVAIFVDVLTTKIVMLFTPGSTVEAEASRINNYFFVALGVLLLLALWKTPLRIRWAALKTGGRDIFRREMLEAAGFSLLLIIVMVVYRLILNGRDPEVAARPWFGLYLDIHSRWFYPFSTVLQELLIKALVQENVRCLAPNGNRHMTAGLTGLFFAILHMNYPLYYLVGAGLLCYGTAYLYERDQNIWGSSLIHFVIGFMPRALGLKA